MPVHMAERMCNETSSWSIPEPQNILGQGKEHEQWFDISYRNFRWRVPVKQPESSVSVKARGTVDQGCKMSSSECLSSGSMGLGQTISNLWFQWKTIPQSILNGKHNDQPNRLIPSASVMCHMGWWHLYCVKLMKGHPDMSIYLVQAPMCPWTVKIIW